MNVKMASTVQRRFLEKNKGYSLVDAVGVWEIFGSYSHRPNVLQSFPVYARLSVDCFRVGQLVVVLLRNGKPDEFTVCQSSYGTVAKIQDYGYGQVVYV